MKSNKIFKNIKCFFRKIFLIFILFAIQANLFSVPTNNFYDPAIIYDFRGTNKYYTKDKKTNFNIQVSPFYQGASGCRDFSGTKAYEGDRLGTWNMLGLFFGREPSAASTKGEFSLGADEIDKNNECYGEYPNLLIAGAVLDGLAGTMLKEDDFGKQANTDSKTPIDISNLTSNLPWNLTEEENFLEASKWGRLSVPIDFEKIGVRSRINFDFMDGFGISVKTGFCNYRQRPTFFDKTAEESGEKARELIQRYLTYVSYTDEPEGDTKNIKKIAKEVELDLDSFSKAGMEDTHVALYAYTNFDLADDGGDLVVSLVPYLSFGVWLPTGLERNQDKAFSLPTGNDGFVGLTLEGAFNLDFPDTVQLSLGGGMAYFGSRNLKNYRVPSSDHQYGIYPWKTNIKRQSGKTFYLNFSFKADDFTENFDFFLDFVHSWHEKDDIKVSGEYTNIFKSEKLASDFKWRAQTIFAGLNYHVAPGLEIGGAFQSVVGGARIYRTTTILGTMTFKF